MVKIKFDFHERGSEIENESAVDLPILSFGKGVRDDFRRRIPHYKSDFTDGFKNTRAILKTMSASTFLYFACLLPTIAFATLNDQTTEGIIDVRKGIFTQAVGHLFFAFFGGQHLNILLTTAPLSLFIKIIHGIAEHFEVVEEFPAIYCCVGLWCSLFLLLSAMFNFSKIMKWSTRSTEEIFALFISIAFIVYAIKDISHDFTGNYNSVACDHEKFAYNTSNINLTFYQAENKKELEMVKNCDNSKARSLLFLVLTLGTFWFGRILYNFKNTSFLEGTTRELVSDYALPLAVLVFSFIGSFIFKDIPVKGFVYDSTKPLLHIAPVQNLSWPIILSSSILGFSLFILIFMDQNIGAAVVNNPSNQLKKGPAYHYDLVIIALINIFCSLFTLPWLHVALPHAPMHVKSLAETEVHEENGHISQRVVSVHETRLSGIISHVLMGLSLFLIPYPLSYIPLSVFDGLYLYMGITALGGNQLFERTLLVFTEQVAYPALDYGRLVPKRIIHMFTSAQLLQLALLCILGFFPYPFLKFLFPFVLLLLLLIRHQVLHRFIEKEYLNILD